MYDDESGCNNVINDIMEYLWNIFGTFMEYLWDDDESGCIKKTKLFTGLKNVHGFSLHRLQKKQSYLFSRYVFFNNDLSPGILLIFSLKTFTGSFSIYGKKIIFFRICFIICSRTMMLYGKYVGKVSIDHKQLQ